MSARPTSPLRAATYARQSKTNEDESTGSPDAQRISAEALATAKGWRLTGHYEDIGASGYDPKADRPGLDALLADAGSGAFDVLVVWKLDRLTRQGVAEAVRLVGSLRASGVSLVSVQEPFFDTSTPMGLGIFALFAAMAEQESSNISVRTSSTKAVLRAAGSHAGGRTPYGFRIEKAVRGTLVVRLLVPEPGEAAVLRDVVQRVLDGQSVASLARDLNARGRLTRGGKPWTTSTLSRTLRTPTLAGYMPARREGRNEAIPRDVRGRPLVATDDNGAPLQPWEPIIDPGDWHRLQEVLDTRPSPRGRSREASLFGGTRLLRCAECGGPMVADRRPGGGAYRCAWHRSGRTRSTCPGVSVSLAHTDDHVASAVFARVSALDPSDPADVDLLLTAAKRFTARSVDPQTAAARAMLEATITTAITALERLDDDRAAGIFDGPLGTSRYTRQVQALDQRISTSRASLAELPTPSLDLGALLDPISSAADPDSGPIGPGSAWDGWDVAQRREFLSLFVHRVLVSKGTHSGGNTPFHGADRLAIEWLGAE